MECQTKEQPCAKPIRGEGLYRAAKKHLPGFTRKELIRANAKLKQSLKCSYHKIRYRYCKLLQHILFTEIFPYRESAPSPRSPQVHILVVTCPIGVILLAGIRVVVPDVRRLVVMLGICPVGLGSRKYRNARSHGHQFGDRALICFLHFHCVLN